MTTITIIAFMLSIIFLTLLTRAVIKVLKNNRRLIRNEKIIKENENTIAEAKRQGKKPFYFDNKRYLIMARSYKEATAELHRMRKLTNIEKK